jgi:hypothetical protein
MTEKVVLWVPTSMKRPESWLCVDAYLQMTVPDGYEMVWKRGQPGNVKVIWNQVVKDFLEGDYTWLWSLHDDVVVHPGTLERLLSWEKPLVSALVFHRHSPVLPHIWKDLGNGYSQRIQDTKKWFLEHNQDIKFGPWIMYPRPDDALVETGFTSTSCTLIHRKVLEDMREEVNDVWFVMDSEIAGGGEDRNFFEHARVAGYPNYVDRSCTAGHIVGDVPTGSADFMMWESVSTFVGSGEEEEKAMAGLKAQIPIR